MNQTDYYSGFSFGSSIDLLAVLSYVLLALGLYTIAKRRGIRHSWLAWVPVANAWLLGCISDQYRYLVYGQKKAKRKSMLVLTVIMAVLVSVLVVLAVGLIFSILDACAGVIDMELFFSDAEYMLDQILLIPQILSQVAATNYAFVQQLLGLCLGVLAVSLPICGISIALMVLQFLAFKDIFASCDPENKTVYTVLGIVLSFFGLSVLLSIFTFVCRNKDGGMPPRRDAQPVADVLPEAPPATAQQPEESEEAKDTEDTEE